MRILFFGSAEFAVPCLNALVTRGYKVIAVVTQPDRPRGRGLHCEKSPVKLRSEELGIEPLQPRRVRSEKFIQAISSMKPDLFAVAAFGQIIPEPLLNLPPYGPINVHGSILPKYRGAAPIQRALMSGETVTGVTTMWMDATLDTGDILLTGSMPILSEDNAGSLTEKLSRLGADLLLKTVEGIQTGALERRRQVEEDASYAPAIKVEESFIQWDEPAVRLRDRLRGLTPRPGVYGLIRGKRIKFWNMEASPERTDVSPGTILEIGKRYTGVKVAGAAGTIAVLHEVQPESGKRMDASSWARGFRLEPGERFHTLEEV